MNPAWNPASTSKHSKKRQTCAGAHQAKNTYIKHYKSRGEGEREREGGEERKRESEQEEVRKNRKQKRKQNKEKRKFQKV